MILRTRHLIGAALVLLAALWIGSYVPAFGVAFVVFLVPALLRATYPRHPRYPNTQNWWWRNPYPAETEAQRRKRSIGYREAQESEEQAEEEARRERERQLRHRHRG